MIDTVSGQSFCVSRRISMPSRSSSRRSVSTTSNSCLPSRSNASLPVVTAVTSSPTTRILLCAIVVRSRDRKRDRERGPVAGTASHLQGPTVRLHDAVRDPETKSGALLHLRREERLEDPGYGLLADPRAGVAHVDPDRIGGISIQLAAAAGLCRDDQS